MADKFIRIGSLEDVHCYDDGDYGESIKTDAPISAGAGTDPDHVLRIGDIGNYVTGPVAATDEALARFDGVTGKVIQNSPIKLGDTLKTGATQVAAGAAAGELWATNGHASLPDNVLMIGV